MTSTSSEFVPRTLIEHLCAGVSTLAGNVTERAFVTLVHQGTPREALESESGA
jgi:hypothetical protein